jgi:hypothetical protein
MTKVGDAPRSPIPHSHGAAPASQSAPRCAAPRCASVVPGRPARRCGALRPSRAAGSPRPSNPQLPPPSRRRPAGTTHSVGAPGSRPAAGHAERRGYKCVSSSPSGGAVPRSVPRAAHRRGTSTTGTDRVAGCSRLHPSNVGRLPPRAAHTRFSSRYISGRVPTRATAAAPADLAHVLQGRHRLRDRGFDVCGVHSSSSFLRPPGSLGLAHVTVRAGPSALGRPRPAPGVRERSTGA